MTDKARTEEDYLRHAVAELDLAAPKAGEEAELAAERARLSNREQVMEALTARSPSSPATAASERTMAAALRRLQRIADKLGSEGDAAIAALDRAAIELAEGHRRARPAGRVVRRRSAAAGEARGAAVLLRDLARKHRVRRTTLAELAREAAQRSWPRWTTRAAASPSCARPRQKARAAYVAAAEALSKAPQPRHQVPGSRRQRASCRR